jgi:hypothetical protein
VTGIIVDPDSLATFMAHGLNAQQAVEAIIAATRTKQNSSILQRVCRRGEMRAVRSFYVVTLYPGLLQAMNRSFECGMVGSDGSNIQPNRVMNSRFPNGPLYSMMPLNISVRVRALKRSSFSVSSLRMIVSVKSRSIPFATTDVLSTICVAVSHGATCGTASTTTALILRDVIIAGVRP